MGCCNSKKATSESKSSETKQFSWEKRENINPSDYILDGINNATIVRKPGSINGQQFVIQNCKNSKIFLLDYIATITIDDCIECQIIMGPVKSSIFFRDCQDCKCIVACQQFRTRDCSKMDVFLSCSTQPIIESSARLRFGCYQLSYAGLAKQFSDASLSLFSNNWSNIHDFTPVPDAKNWCNMPENLKLTEMFDIKLSSSGSQDENNTADEFANILSSLELSTDGSVVPLTRGNREKQFGESCFVVVSHHDEAVETALKIIERLKNILDLVQTKEVSLTPEDVKRIFSSNAPAISQLSKPGPLIGLELNGDEAVKVCAEIVSDLQSNERPLYSSPTSDVAAQEIEHFYNFCDMQMSI